MAKLPLPYTMFVVTAAFLGACASDKPKYEIPLTTGVAELKTAIRGFNLSAPINDLKLNLQHGDYRFIGLYGYVCYPPGVSKEDYSLLSRHGMRCLEGTSDGVESDEHMSLMEQARKYAAAYNAELVQRIRDGHVP